MFKLKHISFNSETLILCRHIGRAIDTFSLTIWFDDRHVIHVGRVEPR
jgi:hypothetical protein